MGESDDPPVGDQYTKLLLHMDGNNDGTVFSDSSSQNHTISAEGGSIVTKTGVNEKKFGTAGCYATGGWLEVEASDDWAFGTDDFTIDFWARPMDASGQKCLISNKSPKDPSTWELLIYGTSFGIGIYPGFEFYSSSDIVNGNWYHVAYVKSGNTITIYENGISKASDTYTGSIGLNQIITVGSRNGITNYSGYIDEVRISKGIARWTENFDVPTEAYTG